jgi:hypothetical protein
VKFEKQMALRSSSKVNCEERRQIADKTLEGDKFVRYSIWKFMVQRGISHSLKLENI